MAIFVPGVNCPLCKQPITREQPAAVRTSLQRGRRRLPSLQGRRPPRARSLAARGDRRRRARRASRATDDSSAWIDDAAYEEDDPRGAITNDVEKRPICVEGLIDLSWLAVRVVVTELVEGEPRGVFDVLGRLRKAWAPPRNAHRAQRGPEVHVR